MNDDIPLSQVLYDLPETPPGQGTPGSTWEDEPEAILGEAWTPPVIPSTAPQTPTWRPFDDLPASPMETTAREAWELENAEGSPLGVDEHLSALWAGFQAEHTVASAYASSYRPQDFRDEGHLPDFVQLEKDGYPSDQFINVRSEAHEDALKQHIDEWRKRQQSMDQSGWGFVGAGLGAVTDPITMGATVLSAGTASVARIAGLEAAGAAGSETFLQQSQPERRWQETAINIAASGILAGAMGAASNAVDASWMRSRAKALATDMLRQRFGDKIPREVLEAQASNMVDDTLSAMRARGDTTMEAEGMAPGPFGLNVGPLAWGPMQRLLRSSSGAARTLATRLGDSSYLQNKNLGHGTVDGEVVGNPISAEGVHRDDMARVDRGIDEQDRLYREYRQRVDASGAGVPLVGERYGRVVDTLDVARRSSSWLGRAASKVMGPPSPQRPYLNAEEFAAEVAYAMRNGDEHPSIPEATQAAQFWRRHGMQEVFERALRSGELVDDHTKAMDSMYRTYTKRYDDDVNRFGRAVDAITESFFTQFQKGMEKGMREAQEADLDTFRAWQQAVREAEAAGQAPPAMGAGVAEAVERGAKTSPWMDKAMRQKVRAEVERYLELHGFQGMPTPAEIRALIKHIGELNEGRGIMPERGPTMGLRDSKAEREMVTSWRIGLRQMDSDAFADEVSTTFGELQDTFNRLREMGQDAMATNAFGARGTGRLTREEFGDAMDAHWRDAYVSDDPMQLDRLTGAKVAWQKRTARRGKRPGSSLGEDEWRQIGLPQRGLIYHTTAGSYFPRMADDVAMARDMEGLRRAVVAHLVSEDVAQEAAEQAAEDIVTGYLKNGRSDFPQGLRVVGEAGVTKARTVLIPDEVLAPWMIQDPANAIRAWSRSLGMRAHFTEEFGDRELADALDEVREEFMDAMRAVETGPEPKLEDYGTHDEWLEAHSQWNRGAKERVALQQEWTERERDLLALRDRLVGRFGAPTDAEKGFDEIMERLRLFNMTTMLGGAALSSVTDIARPLQAYGLRPFAAGLTRFIREGLPGGMKHQDLKDLGIGLVYAHNSRFAMLSDVDLSTLSGWQRWLGTFFLNVSGITTWDTWIQRIAGYTALAGMERMTKGWAQVSKKQKARLARAGIGDNEARVLADMFTRYGPDVNNWPMDAPAKNIVRKALQSDVDQIVFKPNIGNQPLFMSTATGKSLLQFKQFVINANNNMLVAGLQQNDRNFYMAFVVSAAVGAMVAETKSRLRGKGSTLEEEGGVPRAAIEAMGRAGWYGLYEPFKDIGLHAAGWTPSRFAAQNLAGAVGGPTWNQLQRAAGLVTSAVSPDGEVTYNQLAPLVPLANAAHLRDLAERVAGVE